MTSAQWHKLHRRAGIAVVIFILLLAATGILLNHTSGLGLHERFVGNTWLLNWYDIRPKQQPISFRVDQNWMSRIGDRIYFNNNELKEKSALLSGAVVVDDTVVVALDDRLLLLTDAGRLIERLSGAEGVPTAIQAIGVDHNDALAIKTADGYYQVNIDTLAWRQHDSIDARWSLSEKLPEGLYDQLLQLYRGKGLSVERVILDIHSGRILGDFGVYLVDLIGLLFVFLGITGGWMWLSRKLI